MSQYEIYNNITNEIEPLPLLNKHELKLHIFEGLNSYPQCNSKNETKNYIKFKTSKPGRKNKAQTSLNKKAVHNKFCNDNVRRKIKALYNKYIITLLNNLMKRKYKKSKFHFVKMNIKTTKDIGIEYNRSLLNKTIKEIITNVSNKYQNADNNKNCIKFIEKQKGNEDILNILNMTYRDLYTNYYLKSTKENSLDNSYDAHKEKILSLNGKEYLEIFIKNAENFVEFFFKTKNRKSKKTKEVDTINIPIVNELVETVDTLNEKNKEVIGEQIMKTNDVEMISVSTQTDLCDINSKLISFL